MILDAFASEWVKLRRRSLLAPTYAALAVVAALFTVLVFARAGHPQRDRGEFVTLARLAQPGGLAQGLGRAAIFLGVIALSVTAAQMAGEYTAGTLRQLLIRQPRRSVLLAGKWLALLAFCVGAVVFAAAAAALAAVVMAHVRHIPTAAWTSTSGLTASGQALGDTALAVAGFATFGMVLGVVVRSPVASVVIGLAWILPFENIIAAVASATQRWLPGQLLDAIARGGNSTATFSAATWTVAAYLAAAAVAAAALFARRDVTA